MERVDPDLPHWIKDHIRRCPETSGADGHLENGVSALLTTTSRKPGRSRIWPQHGDDQAATDRDIPVVVLEKL